MNKTEQNVLCNELRELGSHFDSLSTRLFAIAAKLEKEGEFCRWNRIWFRNNRKRDKCLATGITGEGGTV